MNKNINSKTIGTWRSFEEIANDNESIGGFRRVAPKEEMSLQNTFLSRRAAVVMA